MVEDRKVVGDLLWIDIGSDRERGREVEGAIREKEIEEERKRDNLQHGAKRK